MNESRIIIQDVRVECERDFSRFAHIYWMRTRFTYYAPIYGHDETKEVCAQKVVDEDMVLEVGSSRLEAMIYQDLMEMCTKEIAKFKEEKDGQLQRFYPQEPVRTVPDWGEAARVLEEHRRKVWSPYEDARAFLPAERVRYGAYVSGGTGDSPFDASHDDRWSGFGTG